MRKKEQVAQTGSSASSAYAWLLGLLDEVGSGPLRHPSRRQCPAHDDETPSLSLSQGAGGRALLYCHAGCSLDDILRALVIGQRHLYTLSALSPAQHARICRLKLDFPPIRAHGRTGTRRGRSPSMKLEAVHDYGGYRLLRYRQPSTGDKSLVWEHVEAEGIWLTGLGGAHLDELPLYRETQVRMGVAAGETIFVVESESSVDAFTRAGLYATTWAGGAAAPQLRRLARVLAGATVTVIPDNDNAGLACGHQIATVLANVGSTVSTLVPTGPGDDARDFLREVGPRSLATGGSG